MKLYSLIKFEDDSPLLLTITNTKNQAKAYARCFIRLERISHFKSWCELRNLDYKNENSWDLYMNTCLTFDDLKNYRIRKLSFNKNNIAETFRLAANCLPIGLPYEGNSEYNRLAQMVAANSKDQQFLEDLKELAAFNPRLDYILTNLNLK